MYQYVRTNGKQFFQTAVPKKQCLTAGGDNEEPSRDRSVLIQYNHGHDHETTSSEFEQEQKSKPHTQSCYMNNSKLVEDNSDSGLLSLPLKLQRSSRDLTHNKASSGSAHSNKSLVNERVDSSNDNTNVSDIQVAGVVCGSNIQSMELFEEVNILDGRQVDSGKSHVEQVDTVKKVQKV